MKEIYSWVPWFQELARKIANEGEADLAKKVEQVAWGESTSRSLRRRSFYKGRDVCVLGSVLCWEWYDEFRARSSWQSGVLRTRY